MEVVKKWALVTGAAHRVGKAIALELAKQKYNIYLHYWSSIEAAKDTERELKEYGVDVFPIRANLNEVDQIQQLFSTIEEKGWGLDVLVNSAASFKRQDFWSVSPDDWLEVINTNLTAPFFCTQYAAKIMMACKRRQKEEDTFSIVNISDLAGVQVWTKYIQHGISKAGLIHLTKITAVELGPRIRVNCVVPGFVMPSVQPDPPKDTEELAKYNKRMHKLEEQRKKNFERLPLKREGSGKDVAKAVIFLVTNNYITGSVIPVDGGKGVPHFDFHL